MIWSKTEAGRTEMQARTLVKERLQRNLLLLIDGVKSEELLLAHIVGLQRSDFEHLAALKLIAPVVSSSRSSPPSSSSSTAEERGTATTQPMSLSPPADAPEIDYAQFTAALTRLISSELGLRGFTLTLAVEKAATVQELRAVAERVLEQVRDRKGVAVAEKARRSLYGV